MPTFSIDNPLPYFSTTPNVGLGVNAGIIAGQLVELKKALTPGPVADTLRFPTGLHFDAVARSNQATMRPAEGPSYTQTRHLLEMVFTPLGPDPGARFLPWEPGKCTYMTLDPAAKFVVTGPLSGCNIFYAGDPRTPMFFHTNSNDTGGLAEGNQKKRKWVLDVLSAECKAQGAKAPGVVIGSLERQQYATQGFGGFVFGFKKNGVWAFYFYGTGIGNVVTIKSM